MSSEPKWMTLIDEGDAKSLHKLKFDVNEDCFVFRRFAGWTPLCFAIEKQNLEIVKLLLEGEADIEKPFGIGWTPLGYAIEKQNLEIVKLLLERRADIEKLFNGGGTLGWTPLGYAIEKQNLEIVKLLLERRADIEKTFSLRMYIVGMEGPPGPEFWTPLGYAIEKQTLEIVKLLLERKADIEKPFNRNRGGDFLRSVLGLPGGDFFPTPLGYAVAKDNPKIVELLLQYGASLSHKFKKDGDEYTPLQIAKEEMAHLLENEDARRAAARRAIHTWCLIARRADDLVNKDMRKKIGMMIWEARASALQSLNPGNQTK